ncbi:MAG: transglutaminase [Hyphomicrobiales bacterium]|nr:MAG: transglutaminase [Hyphomicrobiales bacterium]
MNKQKHVWGATTLQVLLLAVGLISSKQPSIAGTDFDGIANIGASLEKPQAPSYLGGVQLERSWLRQPTAAYQSARVADDYGSANLERRANPSTTRGDVQIDPMQTAAVIPGVFGSVALSMRNFPASTRWAPVYQAIVGCSTEGACERKSAAFAAMIEVVRDKGFYDKLSFVNSTVNRLIAYKKDSLVYGEFDYWAKPLEILDRRAGDCEDFAILKMTALQRAGIPAQSMSLVILQDRKRNFFHAVLSVSTSGGTFILDNLSNIVLRDSDLPDYQPLYSVSTNRAWIYGSRSAVARVADVKGNFASVAPGEGLQ